MPNAFGLTQAGAATLVVAAGAAAATDADVADGIVPVVSTMIIGCGATVAADALVRVDAEVPAFSIGPDRSCVAIGSVEWLHPPSTTRSPVPARSAAPATIKTMAVVFPTT